MSDQTPNAPARPEARAPRGFADKRAETLRAERRLLDAVSAVYERYGFEAVPVRVSFRPKRKREDMAG